MNLPPLSPRGKLIIDQMNNLRLGPWQRLATKVRIRKQRFLALVAGSDPCELEILRLSIILHLDIRDLIQP